MGYLLDTHCWLWLQTEPERFPDHLLNTLADRAVDLFLSAASAWEIGIRHATGRLALPESPAVYVPEGMRRTGTRELPVSHAYALAASALPPHHRDPFDRLLVAQSRLEGLPLVTADRVIQQYDVEVIRVRARRAGRIATCNKSYYHLEMSTFSVKLPDDMYAALAAEAGRRNITRSALVREMIDQALRYNDCAAPPSCAQLAGDLVGTFRSGRTDLGTNERLLEEAMIAGARPDAPDRSR